MVKQVHKKGGRSSQVKNAKLVIRAKDTVPKGRTGGRIQLQAYYRSGIPGSTIKKIADETIPGATKAEALGKARKRAGMLEVAAKRKNAKVSTKRVGL